MLWSDSHNHLADPRFAGFPDVWETARAAGVSRMIVNATCEADWPAVENLASLHPESIVPAFGIHPWKAHLAAPGWETRLAVLLEKHPRATIGEIGIDGWVSSPGREIQSPVFEIQLRLARELRRPCTIHCLKAWEPLFDSFSREAPPERFLLHSFGGSWETARRLLPLGAWFSLSGYFLQPRKAKVLDVFRRLPADRILLETDAPDMLPPREIITHPAGNLNHPANLPAIGTALAKELRLTPDALAEQTNANFLAFA